MTMLLKPLVSLSDRQRLIDRINRARSSWITYAPYLDSFRAGLAEARAVPSAVVPGDLITMNSRFTGRDIKTGETLSYTLVYPEDESPDEGNLCALSPMGMAFLGARVKDVVRWSGAAGPRAVEIMQIEYQPEAAGDYDR